MLREQGKSAGRLALYGLMGFTHGWARVLTLMSPAGRRAILERLEVGEEATLEAAPGGLPRLIERRGGGLDRLVAANAIVLLAKPEWDAKKAELGDVVFR